ncbi:MAG: DUF2589 domain-containing protein [Lachnospiraceae bacterium]|nr:DUF2589 domain-containing protein [Lachnospiraceae bacterium]
MVELETLLTSIASSVQASQDAIQHNAYTNFMKYFVSEKNNGMTLSEEKTRDEAFMPVLQYFKALDSPDNAGVAVPMVALVKHNSLVLEGVKVVLNVSGVPNGNHFMVNTEPINDEQGTEHHQITLEFKKEEPTEGMSRILSAYNRFL